MIDGPPNPCGRIRSSSSKRLAIVRRSLMILFFCLCHRGAHRRLHSTVLDSKNRFDYISILAVGSLNQSSRSVFVSSRSRHRSSSLSRLGPPASHSKCYPSKRISPRPFHGWLGQWLFHQRRWRWRRVRLNEKTLDIRIDFSAVDFVFHPTFGNRHRSQRRAANDVRGMLRAEFFFAFFVLVAAFFLKGNP